MTNYTLAQLQALSDRELDAVVARVVMGWRYEPRFEGDQDGYLVRPDGIRTIFEEREDFSNDPAAAAMVRAEIERRRLQAEFSIRLIEVMTGPIEFFPQPTNFDVNIADWILTPAEVWQLLSAPPRAHAIAAVLACQTMNGE